MTSVTTRPDSGHARACGERRVLANLAGVRRDPEGKRGCASRASLRASGLGKTQITTHHLPQDHQVGPQPVQLPLQCHKVVVRPLRAHVQTLE